MRANKKLKFGPSRRVYKGIIFNINQREALYPNGDKKIFEFCQRPDSVTILPFDKKGRLILIREYRHAYDGYTWFLPAGRVDKGESSLAAARRELREETGFGAKTFKKLYGRSSSNSTVWNRIVYAAKDLYPAPLKGDEYFDIKVEPAPLSKAARMAADGTIKNEYIAYNIIRFHYMLKHGQFKW